MTGLPTTGAFIIFKATSEAKCRASQPCLAVVSPKQDGADAVEGQETENNITKHVKEHGSEGRHLGGTDAKSLVNDRYLVPRLVQRCHLGHRRHRQRRRKVSRLGCAGNSCSAWLCQSSDAT
jgi:hypothetical protein